MKKSYLLELLLLLLIPAITVAQKLNDSISIHRHQFAVSKKDNNARLYLYLKLSTDYRRNNYDSSIFYGRKGLNLAKQMGFKAGEIQGLIAIEFGTRETGNLAEALNIQLQALDGARELKNEFLEGVELNSIGNTYLEMGDPATGLEYYRKSSAIFKPMKSVTQVEGWGVSGSSEYWIRNEASNIGNAFEMLNRLDSALSYETAMYHDKQFPPDLMPELLCRIGNVYVKLRKDKEAMQLYQRGAALSFPVNTVNDRATIYYQMAVLYNKWNRPDSSLYYAQKSFRTALTISLSKVVLNASLLIADLYGKNGRADSAYYYQRIATKYKDALFGIEKFRRVQLVLSQEQQRQQKLLQEREELKNRYRIIGAVAALIFVLIILLLVWRNNRQSKKAYTLLQKQNEEIEAQRKQALIEAALERVRSKTMAMRNSQDVANTVVAMFDELVKLGVEKTVRSGIAIIKNIDYMELWTASSNPNEEVALTIGHLNMTIHPLLQNFYNAWKNKEQRFSYELIGNDVKEYYLALNQSPDYPVQIDIESLPSKLFHNTFIFDEGAIFVFSPEQLTTGVVQIYKRFTGVFELTYRRYLDLQKAEEQAREALIEAALERVRSRTMAMQKSDELHEVIQLVFDQLQQLNFNIDVANFAFNYKETDDFDLLLAVPHGKYPMEIHVPYFKHPVFDRFNKAKKKGNLLIDTLTKDEKDSFFEHFFKYVTGVSEETKASIFGRSGFVRSSALMSNTALTIHNYDGISYSEAENNTLLRFGKVFEQTYTRFLDLQQAEAQTREAKIEAGLERVRAKAMSMHTSEELNELIGAVFGELTKLDVVLARCLIMIFDSQTKASRWWMANSEAPSEPMNYLVQNHENHAYQSYIKAWQEQILKWQYELKGKVKKTWDDFLFVDTELSLLPPAVITGMKAPEQVILTASFNNFGCLTLVTLEPLSDEQSEIMLRFAKVFDMSYTRFNDLKQAEAQAREAIRQTSLDRVRAEIASMRSTSDLQSITPVIWNELTVLGVPFMRCGVFIVDEQQEVIHSYLSTPDGKAIAAFQLAFNADGIAKTVLASWRKKQFASVHWNEEEFKKLSVQLVQQGTIASEEKYLTAYPPTSLDLHFFPFLQGMLYVGNIHPLRDDEKDMVQSLAGAFSTAYARYEDFNKLEAAKQQVEKTLTDLKTAQTQLIQSEKLASLGELTAGIAHEIQNPLNFVNNFSEVSIELLDELKEEAKAGNSEDVIAIASDLVQNLQKINHHGKRADFIVKGMLQHSRTSTGERQPTDINILADEFLKLSYHGLRAKDKNFNAELVTNFDENLPKVTIVQQDIGRVLLNLFNNAFYAISQKAKTAGPDYKPTVEITTFALPSGGWGAKVKDNGNGITDAIKDKIMQPFFTTKPTGEGTGLGLSLSYDIVVKGHGGKIDINSTEGSGSEFIISIPVNN